MTTAFEPKILAFLCTWCSYTGVDAAGKSKLSVPPNVQVIRVMCTGRVDPTFVLQAFRSGMDGVLICGCHPGDCHYIDGNLKAEARSILLRSLLDQMGIAPARFRLEWISPSEASRYAELVRSMTEELRALGPLELPGNGEAVTPRPRVGGSARGGESGAA